MHDPDKPQWLGQEHDLLAKAWHAGMSFFLLLSRHQPWMLPETSSNRNLNLELGLTYRTLSLSGPSQQLKF